MFALLKRLWKRIAAERVEEKVEEATPEAGYVLHSWHVAHLFLDFEGVQHTDGYSVGRATPRDILPVCMEKAEITDRYLGGYSGKGYADGAPATFNAQVSEHELNGTELRIVCFYVNGLNDVRVWEHHVWTFGTDPHFPFSDAP